MSFIQFSRAKLHIRASIFDRIDDDRFPFRATSLATRDELSGTKSLFPEIGNSRDVSVFPNDGRDAFLVMSSAYYDRTCLWSADIFTSVWQENFLFL